MEFVHAFTNSIAGFGSSDYAILILFALAFAESSFFPIPPDVLMIPLALLNPPLALFYALITTVGSVTGGIFGFWIGRKGGKPVLNRFVNKRKIKVVEDLYNKYDTWAIGIAAFTPIPYKIFTISAGVFNLNFLRFVTASVVGRAGRFFLVGLLIFIFGPVIRDFIDKYLEITIILFSVLLIGGFVLMSYIGKRKIDKDVKTSEEEN